MYYAEFFDTPSFTINVQNNGLKKVYLKKYETPQIMGGK